MGKFKKPTPGQKIEVFLPSNKKLGDVIFISLQDNDEVMNTEGKVGVIVGNPYTLKYSGTSFATRCTDVNGDKKQFRNIE